MPAANKHKQIKDLTLHEFDMVYSLSRIGRSYSDIARRYGISENDVKTLVENYVKLRELFKAKPIVESQSPTSGPELKAKKPRKRRSDAIYATPKDRQAAYRSRLRVTGRVEIEKSSPASETNLPSSVAQEFPVTVCEESAPETSPEHAYPQRSTMNDLSKSGYDNAENKADSVMPQA